MLLQEKNLKLEVMVKKQDDVLKQLKHRDNTVLPITPAAHICPSVKAAANRPATPSTFPLNSTQRIDHQLMPGDQLVGMHA